MRLCVNTGNRLHLVRPLGFDLDDARLRRAGLDYREYADVMVHDDLEGFVGAVHPRRVLAYSQHATRLYTDVAYADGDALLFGRESDGLPPEVLELPTIEARLRIPIAQGGRSLNLANAAAIVVYEAWRQNGFR
jgi:tRNA (cytidine/uridine-2'-O-)-methyltransferase